MGQPKQLLPIGRHTIIEQVVTTLLDSPVDEVVVVTGCEQARVSAVLAAYPVRCVFNPDFAAGEMISSVQVGLHALGTDVTAALLAVGDQPQIERRIVEQVLAAWRTGPAERIVIPSYQMRRGHPICLPRNVWPAVWALGWQDSLRSLWRDYAGRIEHIVVDTPSILGDLDTPNDYCQLLAQKT
jgi:molybdenum cofactor cytidylyltransferase